MKSGKNYVISIFASVILVFVLILSAGMITVNKVASPDYLKELSSKNNIAASVQTQLENYFGDKYNETGVPSEVYTKELTIDYIRSVVDGIIDTGFAEMNSGTKQDYSVPVNKELENSITSFFDNYADSIDYEKDDNYYKKLDDTIESAYKVIGDNCDVYKFGTMSREGILNKTGVLYRQLDKIEIAVGAALLLMIIILFIINLKSKKDSLYWIGISGIVSGVIGIVPSIYLIAAKYFDAFTIKQPLIFKSFTTLMYNTVNMFMIIEIIILVVGAILTAVYLIMHTKQDA